MLPVRNLTTADEVFANAKRVRATFFPSRQIAPAQVQAAPKAVAEDLVVAVETQSAQEKFRSNSAGISGEVVRDVIDLCGLLPGAMHEVITPRDKARQIVRAAAMRHGVTVEDILGTCKVPRLIEARFEAIAEVYVALPQWSLKRLGQFFGGRDHTTILNAVKRMGVRRGGAV